MKKTFKALMTNLLVLAMVLTTIAVAAPQTALAGELDGKLVILHTNDVHGNYAADAEKGKLGIDAVAAAKKYYEAQGANVLLLDAGDFSQGTTLVNYYKGLSAIEFMNAAGYDAVSLGNHEFDWGFDALLAMADAAEFPILDANVISKETGKPYFEANKVFEFDNMKVGVFGLDTAETQTKSSPANVKYVSFLDGEELYACAQAQVDELKAAGCDFIICLGHLGVDDESTGRRSIDVMEKVADIDLFVDGHSHTVMDGGEKAGSGLIVSTGTALNYLGVVVYDGTDVTASLVAAADYAGERDEAVKTLVQSRVDEVAAAYEKLFATTLYDLDGNRAPGVRTQETNLGNFAADAYRYAANVYATEHELGLTVDGAISNGGGIRASIPAGEISMNTLKTVFPFGNTVSIVTVTGAQLLEALEAACFACPEALGAFPQTSGIVFTIDTTVAYEAGEQYPDSTYYKPANPGSRVTITSVGGRDFNLNDTYNIATNNFTAAGGDTYYVLKEASFNLDTEVVDSDALIAYVNSLNGVIGEEYKEARGNITIFLAPEPEYTEYTVVAGDYLRKIAAELLGAESLWKSIYEANKESIANPDLIRIGQVLQIPAAN